MPKPQIKEVVEERYIGAMWWEYAVALSKEGYSTVCRTAESMDELLNATWKVWRGHPKGRAPITNNPTAAEAGVVVVCHPALMSRLKASMYQAGLGSLPRCLKMGSPDQEKPKYGYHELLPNMRRTDYVCRRHKSLEVEYPFSQLNPVPAYFYMEDGKRLEKPKVVQFIQDALAYPRAHRPWTSSSEGLPYPEEYIALDERIDETLYDALGGECSVGWRWNSVRERWETDGEMMDPLILKPYRDLPMPEWVRVSDYSWPAA